MSTLSAFNSHGENTVSDNIDYGILTWVFIADRILIIQKKTVRSITLSKYNAHTEPIFKTLKLLKITDISKCQTIKLCYKLLNDNLPVYFSHDDWYFPISNIHCHNKRCQNKLFTYRTNHQFATRYEVVTTFNNTPLSILNKIHTHSINGLSLYLKTHLLLLYDPFCNKKKMLCMP